MSDLRNIYGKFKKYELQEVAQELDISISGTETTRKLASIVLQDLEENGIPEELESISDTLYELLRVAEFIDEDGNVIEYEEQFEEVVQEESSQDIPDWICFSYADLRDPACNRCKLYTRCWDRRLQLRPDCFGKGFNADDPECSVCIEAPYCKKEMKDG